MIEITAFCFVLLALTVFVATPLYSDRNLANQPRAEAADDAQHRLRTAVGELEVDRASGLLDEAAYRAERSALERHHLGEANPVVD
jgi:cytochrome c-type biogenesis protein CcmI